ncbi:MAG: hypothetical protein JRJ29_23120 [Deltaproteobacteria bacterium]|nr:hypothetical protein [Deltaproteobacteria bacterium]
MKRWGRLLTTPIIQLVLVALVTWAGLFFLTSHVTASFPKGGGSSALSNKKIVLTLLTEVFGKRDKEVVNNLVRGDVDLISHPDPRAFPQSEWESELPQHREARLIS